VSRPPITDHASVPGGHVVTVVTGAPRNEMVPIIGHAHATLIAERLSRIAAIMAGAVDVAPHPYENTWSVIVAAGPDGRERPAAVITPYHTNGPVGAQVPPTASWIIAPEGPAEWRNARSPILSRTIARGSLAGRVTAERKDGGTPPGDALRIVLPGYGTGPVMVHPTVVVLRECARFAALAADVVAGRGHALTLAQWDLVVEVAAFGTATPPHAAGVAHGLVHNAGHPLRAERLVRITQDFNHALPRHTTTDLPPPGAPQAMLLSMGNDTYVPTLEPIDTADEEPRDRDAMSVLRAIEAMRAATGWTPPGRTGA
jgi:hypothetical protein